MTLYHSERLRRGHTGTYLGIFASAYVSLFLGAMLAEQMGAAADVLDLTLFATPLVLFAVVGLAAVADDAREYFAAGRSVAPYFSGLSLAVTSLGGVGVVCITGALFKIGIDALALMVGWVTGLVILAAIVAIPLTGFFFHPKDPIAVALLTVTIVAAMFCIRGYLRLMSNVFPS